MTARVFTCFDCLPSLKLFHLHVMMPIAITRWCLFTLRLLLACLGKPSRIGALTKPQPRLQRVSQSRSLTSPSLGRSHHASCLESYPDYVMCFESVAHGKSVNVKGVQACMGPFVCLLHDLCVRLLSPLLLGSKPQPLPQLDMGAGGRAVDIHEASHVGAGGEGCSRFWRRQIRTPWQHGSHA